MAEELADALGGRLALRLSVGDQSASPGPGPEAGGGPWMVELAVEVTHLDA